MQPWCIRTCNTTCKLRTRHSLSTPHAQSCSRCCTKEWHRGLDTVLPALLCYYVAAGFQHNSTGDAFWAIVAFVSTPSAWWLWTKRCAAFLCCEPALAVLALWRSESLWAFNYALSGEDTMPLPCTDIASEAPNNHHDLDRKQVQQTKTAVRSPDHCFTTRKLPSACSCPVVNNALFYVSPRFHSICLSAHL